MSDEEYERFEISDYDLANEFNINRPRGKRHTKHQQIYGIWADDSDNESGDEGGRRGKRRHLGSVAKKPKDYTAPVNFVAGGVQQSGKKKKKDKDKTNDDNEESNNSDDDDDADARPAFGRNQPHLMGMDSESSNSDSDESVKVDKKEKRNVPNTNSRGSNLFQHHSHIASNKNVGAWEQHTRGIGAKLLLQMGYEPGKGLGKDLQGIAQPVQAHVRKGRGAIGAYGPEVAASIGDSKQTKPMIGDEVRDTKDNKEQMNKWRKTDGREGGGNRQGKKYYYKTVEEVIAKGMKSNYQLGEKISKKLGNVPVIDMTGPERRVLSGYHALAQTRIADDEELYDASEVSTSGATAATAANKVEAFSMPELTHNLMLIVNMCEQEIISLDKQEREASDKQAYLEHEYKNLDEIVQLECAHLSTLEQAMDLVEELCGDNSDLTLPRAEYLFSKLKCDYAAEYLEFGLGDLAAGIIAPLVKETLVSWQPLAQPTQHIELIKKWRGLLDSQDNNLVSEVKDDKRNVFDPYSSLVWVGVIPSFRACSENWNPKQHQQMAALLDAWAPLFPTWILDSVLEQLILPRLTSGVRLWDPQTDTVPIHIWILPWNTILGEKMEENIYPIIREKLGAALQGWMPQDRSARAMLTPWKGAFSDAEMQYFLIRHIIPKLQLVLSDFIINPIQQDLEPWYQVWEWHELIPTMLMAQILDKYFFPRWMQMLILWINQSPDYTEISRWYTGWKNRFNEDLLREPNIKEHLRRALEVMHRATETVPSPIVTPAPPPPHPPQPLLIDISQLAAVTAPPQLEFKELVSQKCAELGIIFAPLPGRREMGKQIYRVGKLYSYIDRNVCMLSDASFKNWLPTSLGQLLERAQTGILN